MAAIWGTADPPNSNFAQSSQKSVCAWISRGKAENGSGNMQVNEHDRHLGPNQDGVSDILHPQFNLAQFGLHSNTGQLNSKLNTWGKARRCSPMHARSHTRTNSHHHARLRTIIRRNRPSIQPPSHSATQSPSRPLTQPLSHPVAQSQ